MQIVNYSLDTQVLRFDSEVAKRMVLLGAAGVHLSMIVPSKRDETVTLSEAVTVYAVGGNKLVQLYKAYRMGTRLLRQGKVNVVTTQDPFFLGFIAWWVAVLHKVPLEVQVHGFERVTKFRKVVARFVVRRADQLRVVSRRLVQLLVREYGVKESVCVVLPVFVAVDQFCHTQQVPSTKDDQFTFLTVGRLVSVKNIALQLKALAVVLRQFPNVRLHVVGAGEERAMLEREVAALGLSQHVHFFGVLSGPELCARYAAADAFLLTSHAEGWGMVAIEAACMQVPIIMTDVGLAGEVLLHEQHALVVPVADQEALVKAMTRVVKDQKLRQRLITAAKEQVQKLPSVSEHIQQQVALWGRVPESKRR